VKVLEGQDKKMEDPGYLKYRRYGKYLSVVVRLLSRTLRVRILMDQEVTEQEPFIYVFWHQKLFFPTACIRYAGKKAALASPSRDGEIMATILKNYGFEVIRGSSNDGNIRSLLKMIRKLKAGYTLGLAADGPQGPAFQVKPGIVYMAMKTGRRIVPIGGAFEYKYVFHKAWDRFHLPYPFTRGGVVMGHPIRVPEGADPKAFIQLVNSQIQTAEARAEKLL
jgi:hypothetical protein